MDKLEGRGEREKQFNQMPTLKKFDRYFIALDEKGDLFVHNAKNHSLINNGRLLKYQRDLETLSKAFKDMHERTWALLGERSENTLDEPLVFNF